MSNLLKSKFLLGVMLAAVLAVAGVASAQTTTTTTTTVVASAFTYSGVMKQGMSGPGISTLQAALNSVNTGSVGTIVVDGKFGPATVAAVKKFQMSQNLTADGVVGPVTGAALTRATVAVITIPSGPFPAGCTSNGGFSTTTGMSCAVSFTLPAGCTSTSGFSSTTGVRCSTTTSLPAGCTSTSGFSSTTGARCSGTGSTSTSTSGNLSGGETSITDVNLSDADDDTINEGSEDAVVAELEFDVDDADAELVRADFVFQAEDSADEAKPWRVFDKVSLMDGDDVLASVNADDEDVWEDADDIITSGTEQAYRIRLNDIGASFDEGSSADLWLAVDVASSVDGSDTGADWTVGVDTDGLRFTDSADLNTEEDTNDTAQFTIQEAGEDSEFTVTEDSDSPEGTTVQVKESTSATETLGIFQLEADEDGGDVKLNDFPVGITMTVSDGSASGTSDFADVVDDVMVTIDGTEYRGDYEANSCDVSSPTLADCTAGQTAIFRFDDIEDDDIIIDAGDDMTAEVSVKFHSQGATGSTAYANGTTIAVSADLDDSDVEDADTGDDVGDVNGDATADTFTLAGTGITVDPDGSDSAEAQPADGSDNDLIVFTTTVDVTAFDDDMFISQNGGTAYTVEVQNATTGVAATTPTSTSKVVSTTADTDGTSYRINEGDTETFTFTTTINPATADEGVALRAQLLTIVFGTTNAGTGSTYTIPTDSLSDYRTPSATAAD